MAGKEMANPISAFFVVAGPQRAEADFFVSAVDGKSIAVHHVVEVLPGQRKITFSHRGGGLAKNDYTVDVVLLAGKIYRAEPRFWGTFSGVTQELDGTAYQSYRNIRWRVDVYEDVYEESARASSKKRS